MSKQGWRLLGLLAIGFGTWALLQGDDEAELLPVPPDRAFNRAALDEGTRVELEHTRDRATARTIAKHHLLEDPLYYKKLATIHVD